MEEKLICLVTPTERTYYRAVPIAKEFLDQDNTVINTTGTLPDGEVDEITVSTKTVKHYKEGKLHGDLSIIDMATGDITFSETYKDGILKEVTERLPVSSASSAVPMPHYDGTVIRSNKKIQSFYVKGKEVAERTLGTDGRTLEILGAIPDGPAKEFDENGKIRCETAFKNNELEGETIRYDERGRILSRENYQQGRLDGPAEYYYYETKGSFKTVATYKNGMLHGPWTHYFPNGSPCTLACYKNGKLHGARTSKFTNGVPDKEEYFENGKLHGKRVLHFPEGGIWYEETYKNGRLDGEQRCYFRSGAQRSSAFYVEGLLEGPRRVYSENGDLLVSEEYHWGTLVRNTDKKAS